MALGIIGFGIAGDVGGVIEPSDSSAEIARVFSDRAEERELGAFIQLIALIPFIWFLAYLRRHLATAEGEGGWLASAAYGGGLITVAVMSVLLALGLALTSSYGADAVVAKTIFLLTWNYVWLFAPPLIAFQLATSVVAIRFKALPKWLGWAGIVLLIPLLMPWIGMFTTFLWIAVVSIVLAMKTTDLRRFVE